MRLFVGHPRPIIALILQARERHVVGAGSTGVTENMGGV